MNDEMVMKQLKLQKFGRENITRTIKFTGKPHFRSEEFLFDAFESLFNENYVNETVTKPGYNKTDSYAELTFKVDRFPGDTIIKRVFGMNGKFIIDDLESSPWNYYFIMTNYIFQMMEPHHSSPTRSMSHIMNQFFSQQWQQLVELQTIIADKDENSEFLNGCLSPPVRAKYKEEIAHDFDVNEKLKKLKWQLLMKDHENKEDYTDKIFQLKLENSMTTPTFCDALINIFLASLQHDVPAEQEEMIKHIIQTSQTNFEAYPPDNIEEDILFFLSNEKMKINLKNLRRYASSSSTLYDADDNIFLKYILGFVDVGPLEMEKANIHRKLVIEKSFNAELEKKILDKEEAKKQIHDAIRETKNVMLNLARNVGRAEGSLGKAMDAILKGFQSYFLHKILVLVNEFCEVLCEILNHSTLGTADVKNCIAGMVHCIVNYDEADQPEFLFDHVESRQKRLHSMAQTFLAPLSKILFFPTTEDALRLLERIMADATDDSFATTFIFGACDIIERQMKPVQPAPRILSKIRKKFGYKTSLEDFLSNLQITDQKQFAGRGLNLLQMARKIIYFANNEKMLSKETPNLFALLRIIKTMYTDIKSEFCECNLDALLDTTAEFIGYIDRFYSSESDLRSVLLQLQRLNLELFDVECATEHLQRLRIKSQSRLTIYHGQLRCLGQVNLFYPDLYLDGYKFIEILSAQKANVFDVDNVGRVYGADVQQICEYVHKIHRRNQGIYNYFKNLLKMWQKESADFILGHDIDLQEKISNITEIDFPLSGYYFTKYFTLSQIPRKQRRNNDLSRQEILNQIDESVFSLHFPMVSIKLLTQYKNMLKEHDKLPEIVDRCFTMLTKLLANFTRTQTETLLDLADVMSKVLKAATQNDNAGVRLDVCRVAYDICDWAVLFTKKRCIQSVRYHATVGEQPDVRQDDFIVILLYVCYVLQFTMQPLILNNIVKGRQHLIPQIVEMFSKMKLNRFVLVFVEGLDRNGLDSSGAEGQDAPRYYPNGQDAPGQDPNGQDASEQDPNGQDASEQDPNGQDASEQDPNGRDASSGQDPNEEANHNQNGREETDRNDGEASARHPVIPSTSELGHPNDLGSEQAQNRNGNPTMRVNLFQNLSDFMVEDFEDFF